MNENSDTQMVKGYKEIDLLYGSEIKTNTNLYANLLYDDYIYEKDEVADEYNLTHYGF